MGGHVQAMDVFHLRGAPGCEGPRRDRPRDGGGVGGEDVYGAAGLLGGKPRDGASELHGVRRPPAHRGGSAIEVVGAGTAAGVVLEPPQSIRKFEGDDRRVGVRPGRAGDGLALSAHDRKRDPAFRGGCVLRRPGRRRASAKRAPETRNCGRMETGVGCTTRNSP